MDFLKAKDLVPILDPLQVGILLIFAIALGLAIAWTYRKTHRGFSYSQSFSITLVVVTVVSAFIILLIEDSIARAIGLFGAFSIVRFRTAIKDTRDIAFVFFALATGLAVGTGSIAIGITGVLIICTLIFLLHLSNFGGLRKLEYVLNFVMDAKQSQDVFQDVFNEYLKTRNLLHVEAKDKGKVLFFSFNISLKYEDKMKEFLGDLNKVPGIEDVNVISSKNDLEY
ncbi:MAG: DUF4956 domain-containing protein [Candidatus Gracilibacteria bacterium]|nr:DUF4956 domain-containing protein [Candidatus Gracilibacteria bacterium]